MPTSLPARAAGLLVLMLTATTSLSQFYRSATTVIAPELIRDLSLTPAILGFANACFFIALLVIQVPVGLLFDRIGARATVVMLTIFAVAGALLHAVISTGSGLAAARLLLGLGHGGSFISTIFLISRWYPRQHWSTALSWVFASSMLGVVAAGTPLALASEAIGWRVVFIVMAGVSALVGLLFLLFVRDDPPGRPASPRQRESLVAALRGFITVIQLPGLGRVLALQAIAYAVMATIMGLWAGPYLHDVHGLGPVARGNVLILMAAGQTLGVLVYGPLDRVFDTRKWVCVAGASVTIVALMALAAEPLPATSTAIGLLVGLSALSAYGVTLVAHTRSFYPEPLAGRGATTANMAQLGGCALMPIATGLIAGMFPPNAAGSGYAPIAYQWIFASIAATLAVGLMVYLTSQDIKPGAAPDTRPAP